jgi:hypothetical protein
MTLSQFSGAKPWKKGQSPYGTIPPSFSLVGISVSPLRIFEVA